MRPIGGDSFKNIWHVLFTLLLMGFCLQVVEWQERDCLESQGGRQAPNTAAVSDLFIFHANATAQETKHSNHSTFINNPYHWIDLIMSPGEAKTVSRRGENGQSPPSRRLAAMPRENQRRGRAKQQRKDKDGGLSTSKEDIKREIIANNPKPRLPEPVEEPAQEEAAEGEEEVVQAGNESQWPELDHDSRAYCASFKSRDKVNRADVDLLRGSRETN